MCLVLTTTDSEQRADQIIASVLQARLAACIQTLRIKSSYVWQGEVRNEPELLLILKARRDDFDALSATIRAVHTYDVPEIICIDVAAAEQAYLAWVTNRGG